MIDPTKESVKEARDACLRDFYTFCTKGLSMPLHDQPHKEMCTFISDETQKNKLMLVPRDSWKTSICSTAYPLWATLRAYYFDGNRKYRCLIDSSTVRLSQFVLEAIAKYVRYEPSFIQLFGNLYRKELHKEGVLSLAFSEKEGGGIREPHFLASGVNAAKTGLHFDLISMDDIVTKENVTTLAQREKVNRHYRMMHAILESSEREGQKTQLHVIGTRYDDDDVYGRIIKSDTRAIAQGERPQFASMIRAAIDEEGNLFFPAVLTKEELSKKKRAMLGLFHAQYMNDPNKEAAPFKLEQLRFVPLTEFPETLKMVRMSVDTAIKEEQIDHGDFNCIVVSGWDQFGRPWVLDVSLRRDLTISAFCDLLFTMVMQFNPEQTIIEETTGSLIAPVLQGEMIRRNHFFPVIWIKAHKQQGKQTRWLKMQSVANRGGIHICDEIPEDTKAEIRDQFSRAPFAQYDDFMDAMEMQFQFLPASTEEAAADMPVRNVTEIMERKQEYDSSARILEHIFPHIRALRYEAAKQASDPEYGGSNPPSSEDAVLAELDGGLSWR